MLLEDRQQLAAAAQGIERLLQRPAQFIVLCLDGHTHQPALVLSGMILIAAAAWCTSQVLTLVERKFCPWQRSIDNL